MKNKILFVSSDQQNQKMLADLLSMDYECVPLSSSAEGLAHLQASNTLIDLILIDLAEAVKDEFGILKGIRDHSLYRDVPILIVADQKQAKHAAQIFRTGADDMIFKPLDPDITKQRVLNLLDIGKHRKVHNVMEDLVQSEIENNLDVLGICPCPQCRKDLLTLTLNHSKPRYVSTERGQALINAGQRASMDDRIQLLTEITRYANLVKENPRHEA